MKAALALQSSVLEGEDSSMSEAAIPLPNEKLVRVFDTEQESEAMVVKGLLDSAGIDSQFGDNENSPDVLPVGGIGILVRERDAREARMVIEEYRRTPEQELADKAEFDESAIEPTGGGEG
jgi:putative signal transducing protein